MKIKEIRVHRYGPLADFVLTEPGDFTLLFGPNESGKTLLLDAILRFLLHGRREQALFWNRDRVEHEPNGFVDIQHEDQVLRFPDDGSLPDLLGIQAEDLRNILVVRASDLHVQEGEQKEYYAALTDRLMGIHREPMQRIIDKLLEIGRLTEQKRELSNLKEWEHIASRFKNAQETLEEIEALSSKFKADELIDLERELIEAEEEREEIEKQLALLVQAEKRERYKAGHDLLNQLEGCIAKLEKLPGITQGDYDDWRDAENDIESASEDNEEARGELEQLKEQLERAEAEEKSARDEMHALETKQSSVQELRDEARLHRKSVESDAGLSALFEAVPRAVQVSVVLFALAIIALAIAPDNGVLLAMGLVAAAAFVVSGALWLWAKRRQGGRRKEWETLRFDAAEFGIEVESFEHLLEAVRRFSDDLKRANQRLNEATNERERIGGNIASERQAIKKNEGVIKSAQEALEQLKNDFDVNSLDELEETRQKVGDLEETRNELVTKLGERFGEAEGDTKERMEVWRDRVEELAEFAQAAEDVEYDQAREGQLESDLKGIVSTIEETRDELQDVREKIDGIAQRANEALRPEQSLPGDTLEDLKVIQKELKTFVEQTEEQAALARQAIDILEAIQAEAEQKVKDLFGEDNLASQYFRSITAGAYKDVDYDPESGELRVIRPNEEVLSAYKLSSGTYDQLYLASRLSLADRLLGGEPGFLLLDDPFLTSDSNRLARQLDILSDLAEGGWQIVYFSVKEEVRHKLWGLIDAEDEKVLEPLTPAA